MYTHKQHRQRLRDRFRQEGLDNFSEVHALELLLFYAIPQRDTNEIAHGLLNHFGSVSQVMGPVVDVYFEKGNLRSCTDLIEN